LKQTITVLAILACSLLVAASGMAAEGGGGSAAAWKDFMWRCINVVLFVGIIYKLAGKRIKEFFSGRREQIDSELTDLQNRKSEAEQKLRDVEKSIAGINQERQEILDQAKEQAEAMRQSIIDKAHEDAERVREMAKVQASQEFQQAMDSLRAEMADRIVESAENIIAERLGKKDQEELIDKYLTKVVLN